MRIRSGPRRNARRKPQPATEHTLDKGPHGPLDNNNRRTPARGTRRNENSMSIFPSAADALLECSIVGSFTKLGFSVRSRLGEWGEEPANLTGQTAVVTGSTSGIGQATAAGLLALGADVIVTSRDTDRAEATAMELNRVASSSGAAVRPGAATGLSLDTSSFSSITTFVDALGTFTSTIEILAHNAGALTDTYQTDDRGMEHTLSSHLVGPYLLTKLLEPKLTTGARVIFMSSGGMYTQRLDVQAIEMSEHNYRGAIAYARAKRGQVEMVTHLGPQLAPEIAIHSMHPGWVDTPGVDAGLPGFGKIMGPLLRDADQGADTMIWLAAGGAARAEPGQFWLDREPRRTTYVPGTGTTRRERERLIIWLDEQIATGL